MLTINADKITATIRYRFCGLMILYSNYESNNLNKCLICLNNLWTGLKSYELCELSWMLSTLNTSKIKHFQIFAEIDFFCYF